MTGDHGSSVSRNVLSQEAQRLILNRGALRRHHAGDVLLRQGEVGDRVLLLQAGRVTVLVSNDSGKQLLVAVLGPGSLLGEWAVLDGNDRAATVIALDHGAAYLVPAAAFRYLHRTPAIADEITRYSIRQLRASNTLMVELAHLTVTERLARMLLRIMHASGPDTVEPHIMTLSQTDLAAALGVARSSLCEAWAWLRTRGVVTNAGGKLAVVDRDALIRITRGEAV
jgi:CRP/FNR family transcriptional regulator, cyclic AMP receptor protein